MVERNAQMQQQRQEFDIAHSLQQQQADTQRNVSMAQVAAIQADMNAKNIAAKNAQREYENLPMKQEAANQMNQLLGSINDVDTLNQAQERISKIPNAQLIPSETIQNGILNRKNQLLASTTFQNTQKQQSDERQTIVQAQDLGLDLSNFAKAGTGQAFDAYVNGGAAQIPPSQVFDMGSVREAITQANTQKAYNSEAFKSQLDTNKALDVIGAKNQGSLAVAQTRAQAAQSRITNKADLDFYNAANQRTIKNNSLLAATSDPDEKARIGNAISADEDKMQSIMGKYDTGSSPSTGASSSPKEMGGYKIGTKYAGGLTYLGGDPNSQSSWKK